MPEEAGDAVTPHDVHVTGCTVEIPKWQRWAQEAKAKLEQILSEPLERIAP